MVYSSGRLECCESGYSDADMELQMRPGNYNIYVIANMRGFEPPLNETDIQESMYEVSSIGAFRYCVPMCWSGNIKVRSGVENTVEVNLERLVSKIDFIVNTGVLEGLKVTSVCLRQGANVIRPFMPGGSRVLSKDETGDGDYASASDIEELYSGNSITFYAVENCQGVLLPGNTDPWEKIPRNLGDAAYLCSYIEMKCVWQEGADYEGEVTYRFYLGEDATSDFNIKRNSIHNLTLYLKEDSLDEVCWKIDSSQMQLVKWEVTSHFDKNFHGQKEFYITEDIRIDFQLDDAAISYWEDRDYNFSLAGVDADGNVILDFRAPVKGSGGAYYSIGTCMAEGDFDVVMINNETGNAVYTLNSGHIKVPSVVLGPEGEYSEDKVQAFDQDVSLKVNGSSRDVCLYLVDDEGYNLNQGHYYGCNTDKCDWDMDLLNMDYNFSMLDRLTFTTEYGYSGNDSYLVKYNISFDNDGLDTQWNDKLTGSLGEDVLSLNCCENTSGSSGNMSIGLRCDDITVTMKPVPDNLRSQFGTEFMYVVKNTSKLPFRILGIKENSLYETPADKGDLWDLITGDIEDYISSYELVISKMGVTECSFDTSAATSYVSGNEVWYAADDDGVDQGSIPSQLSLFHVLKAELVFDYSSSPDIVASQVLDGSSTYVTLYGNEGYRNVGMKFYSNGTLYEDYNSYDNLYTDFKYYGAMQDEESIDIVNEIIEITLSVNENNQITATSSEPIEIQLDLSGSLFGHIRCATSKDPFDTIWGHYFKDDVTFSTSGTYSLDTSPVVIGGSLLSDAYADMREIKYYSGIDFSEVSDFRNPSYLGSTTIREYLKPYAMSMEINITPHQDKFIAVRFEGEASFDYTTSDPVTWSGMWMDTITMVPSSYSGFDDKLEDEGCPSGETFKEEVVSFAPETEYVKNYDLYYVTGK